MRFYDKKRILLKFQQIELWNDVTMIDSYLLYSLKNLPNRKA